MQQVQTRQPIHLIADDLTGACDTAATFLPGDTVRVWLGSTQDRASDETVQAFNTDSRKLSPEDASQAVAACALRCPRHVLPFKKIDSAGRGPIAAELLAAQRALHTDVILLAPSFPAHGRVVSEGILQVHPASGLRTRISLTTLFDEKQRAAIANIRSATDLHVALTRGKRIAICDAATDEDLVAIVHVAATLGKRILYAGSAGLARALATFRHTSQSLPSPPPPIAHKSLLLIVGTHHPVTQLQLAHLNQHQPDANLLVIRCERGDDQQVVTRFAATDPDALILTGGDTALLALRALGARSIELQGEVAPGIPWGLIDGGIAHRRIVVTKSGGFGAAPALKDILTHLSGNV